MNNITLVGRVVRDFSCKSTPSGVAVATMTVAVDKRFKKDEADFFDCILWRQTAENAAKYLGKGSLVAISGRMESRKWQTKDGQNRLSWEVNVDELMFLNKIEKSTESAQEEVKPFAESDDDFSGFEPENNDDLPF